MRTFHAIALAALLPLAACGRNDPPPANPSGDAAADDSALSRKIQAAMAKASEKLENENISVGGNVRSPIAVNHRDTGKPRAEISPQGDLLIDGKAVAVTAGQRKLLLEHRANLVAIAQAGIAIGMQGADLGLKAATGALKSVFSGSTDEFEKRMEAEGKRIEAEADKLCARLPALLASQNALAAALPEFRPYATMDASDVEDCGKDGNYDFGDAQVTAKSDVDAGTGTDTAAAGDDPALDAAAEADAAAKGSSAKTSATNTENKAAGVPTYITDEVKFIFPDGRLTVTQKNGITTLNTGKATVVLKGKNFNVNGKSMPMPPAGSTVRVEATGRVEIL